MMVSIGDIYSFNCNDIGEVFVLIISASPDGLIIFGEFYRDAPSQETANGVAGGVLRARFSGSAIIAGEWKFHSHLETSLSGRWILPVFFIRDPLSKSGRIIKRRYDQGDPSLIVDEWFDIEINESEADGFYGTEAIKAKIRQIIQPLNK